MSSDPDKSYWAKAATDPLAPATLWIYPELKNVEPTKQRPVLAAAARTAAGHWLTRVLRNIGTVLLLVGVWAVWVDRMDYRHTIMRAFHVVILGWAIFWFVRSKLEVRAALSPANKG